MNEDASIIQCRIIVIGGRKRCKEHAGFHASSLVDYCMISTVPNTYELSTDALIGGDAVTVWANATID